MPLLDDAKELGGVEGCLKALQVRRHADEDFGGGAIAEHTVEDLERFVACAGCDENAEESG